MNVCIRYIDTTYVVSIGCGSRTRTYDYQLMRLICYLCIIPLYLHPSLTRGAERRGEIYMHNFTIFQS